MKNLPNRKRNRLEGYDYSKQGAYFITICSKDKKCIFSKIIVGSDAHIAPQVKLTPYGKIVEKHIKLIPEINSYVIMPNHIHLIVIKESDGTNLSQDIKSFKTVVSKQIGKSIWQTSFYDHIIRDKDDYLVKCKYIENNPAKWIEDEYYSNGAMWASLPTK